MDYFSHYFQPLVSWLNQHPHWAGIITFLIAFSESLAIVGSIVPGSVTMTAVGILIGSGVIPLASTFIWAILGAIFGDSASYYLGYYYHEKIGNYWPFRKHPHLLASGKIFFATHGGKSVFIGRFLGPLRSIIPVVAGMMRMPNRLFLTANISSAILWSFLYILPGVLLGATASSLSVDTATRLLLYVLGILLILWLLAWLIKWAAISARRFFTHHINEFWQWLSRHPTLNSLALFIQEPQKPQSYTQITLLCYGLFSLILFLLTLALVKANVVSQYNHELFSMLQSIRGVQLDKFFLGFTYLADKKVIFSLLVIAFFYLYFEARAPRAALHFLSNGLITAMLVYLLKPLIHSARPVGLVATRHGFSFPSGHTTLSTAVLGFITYLLIKNTAPAMRRFIIIPMTSFFFLVGFSRLYLGAHWLSDVIGAYLLASTVLFAHIISYQRQLILPIERLKFSLVCLSVLLFAGIGVATFNFNADMRGSQTKLSSQSIAFEAWWENTENILPSFRKNRLGKPTTLFNLQWAGSLGDIKAHLSEQGWRELKPHSLAHAINRIANKKNHDHLPLLPQLYNNKRAVITFIYHKKNQHLILRLWHSLYQFNNRHQPLWIGAVTQFENRHPKEQESNAYRALKRLNAYYQFKKLKSEGRDGGRVIILRLKPIKE